MFCLPGNRPGLWLPEKWDCVGTVRVKIAQSRKEQAIHLDKMICENARSAKSNAILMEWSFKMAFFTVFASGVVLLVFVLL